MGSKGFDHKLKETVRQHFGTVKECHNLRYTREVCNSKMKEKNWACFGTPEYQKLLNDI